MPKYDGFQTLAEVVKIIPRPQVVILSMHADPNIIRQALRGGAIGYIVKQSVADELLAAVRAAKSGSMFISSGISGVVANNFFVEDTQSLLDRLSLENARS